MDAVFYGKILIILSCFCFTRAAHIALAGSIATRSVAQKDATGTASTVQVNCSYDDNKTTLRQSFRAITVMRQTYHNNAYCQLFHMSTMVTMPALMCEEEECGGHKRCDFFTTENRVAAHGYATMTINDATCQDAGVYYCDTTVIGPANPVAEAVLEMLPGPVELSTNMPAGTGSVVQEGTQLRVYCRLMTTLDVRWHWQYSNGTSPSTFVPLDDSMDSIATVVDRLNQIGDSNRCRKPWETGLFQQLVPEDTGRTFKCYATYTHNQQTRNTETKQYAITYTIVPRGRAMIQSATTSPPSPSATSAATGRKPDGGTTEETTETATNESDGAAGGATYTEGGISTLAVILLSTFGALLAILVIMVILLRHHMLHWPRFISLPQRTSQAAAARTSGGELSSSNVDQAQLGPSASSFGPVRSVTVVDDARGADDDADLQSLESDESAHTTSTENTNTTSSSSADTLLLSAGSMTDAIVIPGTSAEAASAASPTASPGSGDQ